MRVLGLSLRRLSQDIEAVHGFGVDHRLLEEAMGRLVGYLSASS